MREKEPILGTESCLTAGEKSGNQGGIIVFSIIVAKSSFLKELFNRRNLKFIPLQYLYNLLCMAPSFHSPYIWKITEVKLPSYSRVLEVIQFVKHPVWKDIDAEWLSGLP